MAGLQVELILRLLADDPLIRPHSRLGVGFGIVVIILLPLPEWLDVNCRNDPRFMSERPQRSADKMGAEARLHTDDAGR